MSRGAWLGRGAPGLAAKGFCMGAADVVPGVSGGTMAFILGIYPRLIAAINSFDTVWVDAVLRGDWRRAAGRPHFPFLIPLGLGILAALMFFTRVVPLPRLIVTHPQLVYALFFGLIASSALVLTRELSTGGAQRYLFIAFGVLIGFYIVNLVPRATPEAAWFVFLSGSLSITAMILPGVSGSFVLLVLGKYAYVFDAIGYFDFEVLLPFAAGALAGLLLFSRLLGFLLHRFRVATLSTIIGILIASLWIVWPFQERRYEIVRGKPRLAESTPQWPAQFDLEFWSACALMLVGTLLVLGLSRLARSSPKPAYQQTDNA